MTVYSPPPYTLLKARGILESFGLALWFYETTLHKQQENCVKSSKRHFGFFVVQGFPTRNMVDGWHLEQRATFTITSNFHRTYTD